MQYSWRFQSKMAAELQQHHLAAGAEKAPEFRLFLEREKMTKGSMLRFSQIFFLDQMRREVILKYYTTHF